MTDRTSAKRNLKIQKLFFSPLNKTRRGGGEFINFAFYDEFKKKFLNIFLKL